MGLAGKEMIKLPSLFLFLSFFSLSLSFFLSFFLFSLSFLFSMVFRCFRDSDELLTRQEFVVGGSHLAAADPLPDSFQMPGKRIGVDGVLTQGEGWMEGADGRGGWAGRGLGRCPRPCDLFSPMVDAALTSCVEILGS